MVELCFLLVKDNIEGSFHVLLISQKEQLTVIS